MIVVCPHCKRQHSIDESLIPHNARIARCKSCGQRFKFRLYEKDPDETQKTASEIPQSGRIIGVLLSKGGVGKTTTAVNLSAGLALAGYKVLLIDADTQGQAGYMLGVKPKSGLVELVTKELSPEEAVTQARERLWLLAGGKSLAGIKRLIDRKDFGGEFTLAEALSPLENQYDYIIVDTSPGWDALTISVLFYVKEVLAPITLDVMALHGFVEFLKSLSTIREYRKEVTLKYLLPTFLDNRIGKPPEILERLEQHYYQKLCKPIRYNLMLSKAPAYGQTIYEYAPGSPGSQDYRELVKKVAGETGAFQQQVGELGHSPDSRRAVAS